MPETRENARNPPKPPNARNARNPPKITHNFCKTYNYKFLTSHEVAKLKICWGSLKLIALRKPTAILHKIPDLPKIRRIFGRSGILRNIIVVVLQIFNEPRSGEVKNLFSFCKNL